MTQHRQKLAPTIAKPPQLPEQTGSTAKYLVPCGHGRSNDIPDGSHPLQVPQSRSIWRRHIDDQIVPVATQRSNTLAEVSGSVLGSGRGNGSEGEGEGAGAGQGGRGAAGGGWQV